MRLDRLAVAVAALDLLERVEGATGSGRSVSTAPGLVVRGSSAPDPPGRTIGCRHGHETKE